MVIQSPTPSKPSGSAPPTFEKVPQNCRFVQGGNANFELKVKGNPKPQVKWTRRGTPLTNSAKYSVKYDDNTGISSLQINQLQKEDEGEYTCTASNQFGEAVCNVLIQSDMAPTTQRQFQQQGVTSTYRQTRTVERKVGGTIIGTQTVDRRVTQKYEFDGSPVYYTNGTDEGFKVDTFEYRLLREIDFREAKTKRHPGETETETETDKEEAAGPTAPPQLLQRLRNSKLLEGSDATFQAKLAGHPKPRITWFKNGQRIVASQRCTITFKQQTATLHIHMALPEDAGHYTLLAENTAGRVACSAQLVIEAIGTQDDLQFSQRYDQLDGVAHQRIPAYTAASEPPESEQTVKSLRPNFAKVPGDKEVTEGKMVRFDCRVTGRPYPEVFWYLNSRPILDDNTHKLIVNEAGNHSLLITVAQRSDAGTYTCIARNKGGEASFQLNLTVIEKEQVVAPKFVERFQTMHIREGEPVSLHCRAVGTPIPHITWQKDGIQIHSTAECTIQTDGGSSSLHIRQLKASDSAWYQCTAQNIAGSTATRARLYVEVEQLPIPEPWRLSLPRPTKVIQPEGSPEREVIWLRHVERAQHYRSHPEEEPRVSTKPMFTHPLKNLEDIQEGDRAHFEARLIPIGDPAMQVEWYFNGRPLPASSRFMTSYRFGYVSLTILHVYSQDQGIYTCRAVNELGEDVTSSKLTVIARARVEYASQHPESMDKIQQLEEWERYYRRTISVEEPPQKPTFVQQLRNLTDLQEGQYAHLEAKVTPLSDPTMKIEWYFNNKPLTASSRITTIYSFGYVALNIMHLRIEDSGTYTCRAINRAGEAISTATVTVTVRISGVVSDTGIQEQRRYIEKTEELEAYQKTTRRDYAEEPVVSRKPEFKTQIKDQINVMEGQSAHFEAMLEPIGDSTMKVEWLKNGQPLEASSRITTYFNFGYVALTIKTINEYDVGVYLCRATNKLGTDTTKAKLTVITKGNVIIDSQHPEGLEKIRHLEDTSKYTRKVVEETVIKQLPRFTVPLQGNNKLVEGQAGHFEARLEPTNDPTMKVEWFLNGKPLQSAHRYKTYFDFGYVALDILYVFPEDTGLYSVKATNSMGTATQTSELFVKAKKAIDTSAIHKVGLEKIQQLEDSHFYLPHYDIEEISKTKPIFKIPLADPGPLKEGQHIHLECRLEPIGDPTMRVEWFFNGRPLTIGSRFKPLFDFGYVALDITNAYPEDSGEYTLRATNHLGSAHTSSCITITGIQSIDYQTQHPAGLEAIHALEDTSRYQRKVHEERVISQMPTFVKTLHSVEVVEGSNVHLECRLQPVGDVTMKVEWLVNGRPVPTGHRFKPVYDFDYVALDILTAYPEDSGVYNCRAVNKMGEAVTSASIRVIAKKAIILESQHPEGLEQIQYLEDTASRHQREMWTEEVVKVHPRFLTKFKDLENLREGQNAHFECRLEPITDPNLKVEWFKNGKSLTIGHRFRPIHDFGYVALDILGVVEEDSGTYTCRATNMVGSEEMSVKLSVKGSSEVDTQCQHPEGLQKIHHLEDSSKYIKEEIHEEVSTQAPVFTSSIQNITIKEGQRAHFECRLIPVSDPNLKVEWFHNGRPVKSGSRFVETHNFGFVALDILTAYPEDGGTYTCKATNPLGSAVTSAILVCTAKKSVYLETQHEGSMAKIQQLEDTSKYYRSPYLEDVTTQSPVFTQAMKDLRLFENQSAHFECRLIPVGDPKLKVEWFRNGIPLETGTRITTMHDFGFVSLDFKYVRPEDSGTYTCKATNELGSAVTTATMVVQGKGSLMLDTQHPEGLEKIRYLEDTSRYQRTEYEDTIITMGPKFVTPLTGPTELNEGQSSHYECRIEPHTDPNLKVEWFFNGKPLQTRHRFMTMFDFGFAALDILSMIAEDTGEYSIKATNKLGTAVSSIRVRVTGKGGLILESQHPEGLEKIALLEDDSRYKREMFVEAPITAKPQFERGLRNLEHLLEGESAHLECSVIPTNDPSMKVEWFFNGRPIPTGHRFRTTYDFGYIALDILYVYPEDTGTYMCKATNANGEAITTCHIQVEAIKKIHTETLHEEGLKKIQALESQYVPEKEEIPFVSKRPEFIVPLVSLHNLKEGDRLHLECRLEPINDPKLRVEWFINGIEIKKAHRFRMTHDFGYVALDLLYAYPEDSGTFMCKATNDLGEAVTTCSVQIQSLRKIFFETQHPEGWEKIQELEAQPKYEPIEVEERPITKPLIISPLMGTTDLIEGQRAHLECRVEPVHDPQLTIEFTHNGKPLPAASRFHITFDFGYIALDISHVFPEDAGEYIVTAKNKLGQASSSITIRVKAKSSIISDTQHPEGLEKIRELEDESRYLKPEFVEPRTTQRPVFTVPLMNLDLSEHDAAHLECRLIPVGDPTLKVEWFFNEKPLSKSSRFMTVHDFGYVALDISYVRPDDTGVYMCRASNELGEAVTTASLRIRTKANILYDTANPEGLQKIHELEDGKNYRPPEAPEKPFDKPVFTAALTGPRELMEGQRALFECRVTPVGDPNLKFEWYVNGIELQKGTRFKPAHDFGMVTLEIASVIPEDSGVYMCKASNLAGEAVTSTSMRVRPRHGVLLDTFHEEGLRKTQQFEYDASCIPEQWVEEAPSQPPRFTQHLTSLEHVIEDDCINLRGNVVPTTDPKLKVEWYKNGKPLDLGTRMRTVLDFGLVTCDISGARPDDSGIYTCRAYNDVGEAISTCTVRVTGRHWIDDQSQNPAALEKIRQLEEPKFDDRMPEDEAEFDSPVFISHLNNVELHEGDDAHFACRIQPARDKTMKIEFYFNGELIPLATRYTVTCEFGYVTLVVTGCNLEDAGVYMCKATNNKGQAMSAGTLKVHTRGGNVFYETTHPMGEAGLEKVREAEAAYLAKYQQVDTEAEIVYPKPTFIVPLQANFVVNEAEPLQMECRVEPAPDPNLTVEWFFNGKPLDTATRFNVLFEFGHVVMNVTDLWPRDCGIYTCRARNRAGEAFTTTTIRVIAKKSIYEETTHPKGREGLEAIEDLEESLRHVEGALPDEEGHPPVFTSQFENLTNLNEGDIAHFEASLTPAGDQTMVVEWFFKNQPLKAGHRIRTVHAFGMVVLEILGVYVEDSGEYTCRATNRWGRAEITVRLECIDLSRGQKPHFTTHIQSLVNLNEGQSAHFECHLIPVGDPTMVVEWFHNGRPLRHSSRIKTLSDFGYVVLDIAFVHPEDSGEYVCKATNKYGEDTTRAVIQCRGRGTLFFDSLQPQSLERIAELEGAKYTTQAYIEGEPNQPPRFVNHLTNVEHLIEGQSAHFEASLTPVNDPELKVTWYFNGKKLQHGHRFRTFHDFGIVILDILYCYEEDSGVYEARAKNRYGRDITKATLTCSSKKSLIFDTQLPASMEGGLEKIRNLDDPYYRVRREVALDSDRQAPVFTVPLQNVTDLRESENAHLEARLIPVDDPNLTVEWFRNGKSIKTGSRIRTIHDFGFVVLELSPVYPEDSGEYSCRAKNELGEAVTTCILKCEGKRGVILETQLPKGMETGVEKIAQLESYSDKFIAETWMDVDESKPPKFVSQPQDLNLMENSLAHFECQLVPVGDPSLKVEWFHNGKPLTAGSRVKTIHDFGFVILEVSDVYQRDAGLYTCKASNKHGEASVSVKLSVKGRLGVIMEPQLPSDFKSGTESIQKLEESLHQKDETVAEEEVPRPPVFITQIQDQANLNEGEPAHFECRVEPVGDASMKIEWFHNGRPLDTGSRIHYLDDFGFIVLDFDWTFPRDSGEYICRATNLWGTAITKAKLICKGKRDVIVESQLPQGMSADRLRDLECPPTYVAPAEDTPLQPPKFTTQIQPLEDLQEGDSAHFECRLIPVNDPKLKVEWFHNGKPLMSGHRFKTTHDFDFVALDIMYAYAEDSGEYMAHASNDLGEDKTKAHLQCKGGMSIILYNQMPKGMKKSEAVVQMEAALRKYTKEIHLTEKDIFDPDKKQPPKFITQIRSRTDLKEFEPAKFECQLSPVGDPHMKVEWFFNGRQLAYKNRFNPIYDFGYVALDFGWVYPEDSGEYICRATNLHGTDETRAVLKSTGEPNIVYESQLPKEMGSSTLRRIREIESAWVKVPDEEEEEHKERSPPQFIIMLEPETVNEGEWAKFFCRVTGFPKARVLWLLNGHAIPNGSRYKLWYDGMYRLDIPKTRQYDAGKVEVIARNSLGEARCSTILEVRPKHDDYRALLKNSPRPWYDTDLKRYQDDRFECELDRKFEESLSRVHSQVYHTVDSGQHEHKVTPIDRSNEQSELALAFKKRRMDSEAYYKNLEGGGSPDQRHITIVKDMAETYESNIDTQYVQVPRDPHETSVHGKEIHTQRQTQTQKEMRGDTEVTRKTTVTETVEQEHKGTTKERIVKGPVPETKPPIFTKKLQPCRTFEKESGRFECEFSGLPPPTVTWYRENFPIKSSPDFQITTTDKKSILVIKEVYMEDSGVFSVIAENRGGTAKSTSNLVVEERKERRKGGVVPPSFTVTMQDVHVQAGQLVRLDAKVSGSKPLDVYWLKGNKKVLPDIRYKMLEEDDVYTLLIIEAFAEDAGVYDCVAINQGGEARCQAQVQVEVPSPKPQRGARAAPQAKPDIKGPSILEPIKDQTVTEGQRAIFTFRASAHPAPTVKWFRGNNLVKQSRYFRMSEEGDRYTLTISEAFPEDEGTYKCVLSNTAGTLTLSAHLTVLVPESATTPPTVKQMTNVAVREGQPARFITEVSGTPTPTVQWFREGVQIPQSTDFQMTQEGTRCTLLIANTYVEDSGRYTCRATNPSGQVEASAHLRVESKR